MMRVRANIMATSKGEPCDDKQLLCILLWFWLK